MDAASPATAAGTRPPLGRRADAGSVRLGGRDVAGLLLCGDMHGAPYDLLAGFLGVRPDRLRGIVARWRHAGYADTGRLGPGPAWCWLTRPGLAVTGQRYAAARPALARLAHIRAVLAVRLSLEDSDAYQAGRAWWRSERRIRAAAEPVSDPALLDELPYLPGILRYAPEPLIEQLLAALDVQCLYRKNLDQVTIWATITDTTPRTLAALLANPRTDTDTAAPPPPPPHPPPPETMGRGHNAR
jgi:hypothetical protein